MKVHALEKLLIVGRHPERTDEGGGLEVLEDVLSVLGEQEILKSPLL